MRQEIDAAAILDLLLYGEKLKALSDEEFALLMSEQLPTFGREGAMIDEAIRRIDPNFFNRELPAPQHPERMEER
jgi:hypothetical protein